MNDSHWGYTQSIDLYDCPKDLLTNQKFIREFLLRLCKEIEMKPYGEPLVYRFGEDSLEGVSGFLFIMTSSITIHCDEVKNRAFIDIFSCKTIDYKKALSFITKEFKTTNYRQTTLTRG
jgi:S-adenosylmethionine/arginine decarboxylase-like enzyme